MVKLTRIPVFMSILLILIVSCGVPGPGGAWISHINKVQSILDKNSSDPGTAVNKAIAYMQKNEKRIKEISAQLKKLSPEKAEKVYLHIIHAQESFIEYINTHPTKDNPYSTRESFVEAVALLFELL